MTEQRVLIVDDSPSMRRLIASILARHPNLTIVGEAGNAHEARDLINTTRPDVMTLDVEMPNMNGVEFLQKVMKHRPMPVVMVSTLTGRGSKTAVDCLAFGAVDCVEKPRHGQGVGHFAGLADIVYIAAKANIMSRPNVREATAPTRASKAFNKVCLLGGSTGAVDAIEQILKRFPENCPPTLITQHMPETFLTSFAARLDQAVAPKVSLAQDNQVLKTGEVLVAPGGAYHLNILGGRELKAKLVEGPLVSGHRPSVDSMMLSARDVAHKTVAGILTGMGRDGADGMAQLRGLGARTLGQSEKTCVVFGMPRVAGELGGVEEWADLDGFADKILELAQTPIVEMIA